MAEALADALQAQAAEPADAWTACMRRGDWTRAWTLSDACLAEAPSPPQVPRHLQRIWTGAPLAGRCVLVRCYHGLGDTLQFVRYLPRLREIAAETVVWAQPKLLPLLRTAAGIDRLLPLHDGEPGLDYEVDVELMELAHAFRSTPWTVPAQVPYLHAEPLPLPPRAAPRVGLVWRSGEWDPRRSIPFALLAPLARCRAQLYVLQPDAHAAGWREGFGTWLGEFDLAGYARALRAMDLVITIDSMPAHLAGALGVPVWTLLPTDADWRWMDGRDDTPWYPTMRLFRQRSAGQWRDVVERVADALEEWCSARDGAG